MHLQGLTRRTALTGLGTLALSAMAIRAPYALAQAAAGEHKVALVVGNAAYRPT